MSDRYTISTYINKKNVDIGYYKNWPPESLFYEAVAIMALFGRCETEQDYYELKVRLKADRKDETYGDFREGEKVRKELEDNSEWPIIVDLTTHNLYINFGAMRPKDLYCKTHTVGELYTKEEYRAYALRKGGYWNKTYAFWISRHGTAMIDCWIEEESGRANKIDPIVNDQNVDELLEYYRVPMTKDQIGSVLTILQDEPSLHKHLSVQTIEMLTKSKSTMAAGKKKC